MTIGPSAAARNREVILGRHSRVGRALQVHPLLGARPHSVIGHRDLPSFSVEPGDRIWVLSYSREPAQNTVRRVQLRLASASEIVYVSSSSTIVCGTTLCYGYPRVKHQAELVKFSLKSAGIKLNATQDLPTTIVLRADRDTPFSSLFSLITTCQANGFRKYALKAMNSN